MRKISAGLFISLDGVVEFPERWGFRYMDVRYMDEDMSEAIVAGIDQADACCWARQPTLMAEESKVHGNGAISVTYRTARSGEQAAVQTLNFPAAASR